MGRGVGIQLLENCVCHLDTAFGLLQQCFKYTRRKGCTAVVIERLEEKSVSSCTKTAQCGVDMSA